MNTSERDKFLTEAMGWYEEDDAWVNPEDPDRDYWQMPDFSTWEGFGKLYTWSKEQGWWKPFVYSWSEDSIEIWSMLINPDRFADAVYDYLKEKVE